MQADDSHILKCLSRGLSNFSKGELPYWETRLGGVQNSHMTGLVVRQPRNRQVTFEERHLSVGLQ